MLRLLRNGLFVLACLLIQTLFVHGVHAQSNTIGFPSSTQCPTTAPSLKSGTNPGFPGSWWNPSRYGTGWDVYFSGNPNQLVMFWLTYNANHQPVWLFNGGNTTLQTAANGAKEFWSPLYQVNQVLGTTNTTTAQVGQVAIVFVPGSTTVAAIRWQWNSVSPTAHYDECIYDFFHGAAPATVVGSAAVNESYTGSWYNPNQAGWGLDVSVGTYANGNTYEIDNALLYDKSGNPVWLEGSMANPTTTATTATLAYNTANYAVNTACSKSNCVTSKAGGSVTRNFISSQSGYATIATSVTTPDMVTWPNSPYSTGSVNIVKLTDYDLVAVDQTNCQVSPGQTCPVAVSWSSHLSTALVYRRYLNTGILSATPIASTANGQYTDNLAAGADVQYEMHNGAATAALLYTSAEVKVTQGAGLAPLPSPVADSLPASDASTGTMAGQAGTSGGAATYTVPIVVPPGRAGMQPSLSLNYNSRSGNGVMGLGWSISGLSSIHRCPQTPEQDGQTLGVAYTDNDRLCLDGQRLVTVSGSYGQSGAHYRTEVDSYADIIQYGADLQSGSTYFVVQERDGRLLTYGQLSSAQVAPSNGPVDASGRPIPLSWLVQQIQDRVGNNEVYAYTNEGYGEVLLSTVTYTGFGTTAGNRTVTFAYQPRTNISDVNDVSSSYLAGGLTMQTQALASVTTAVAGSTVRIYTPSYAAAKYSGRLTMTSMQECGGGTCHPATQFRYNDGALDYSFGTLNPINQTLSGLGVQTTSVTPIADLDGDGVREYAVTASKQTDDVLYTYLAQIFANSAVQSVVDLTGTPFENSLQFYTDVDGDGRAKLILLPQLPPGTTTPVSGVVSFGVWNGPRGVPASALVPASGSPAQNFAALFTTVSSNIPVTSGDQVYAADMNGDGKMDIVVVHADPYCNQEPYATGTGTGVFVYLNAMTGPLTAGQTAMFTPSPVQPLGLGSLPQPSGLLFCLNKTDTDPTTGATGLAYQTIDHIADFNGDGLPDFYITYTVSLQAGNGSSTQFDSIRETNVAPGGTLSVTSKGCTDIGLTTTQCLYSQTPGTTTVVHWMDVNGDGLEDFVQAGLGGTWQGTWHVNLNHGGTLGATIDTGSSAGLDTTYNNQGFRYAGKTPMMDVDGDGKPDLLTPSVTKGFALKMCTMTKVAPLASGDCATGTIAASPSGVVPAVAGNGQCVAYACPEEPGSTVSSMPKNGDTQVGYSYAWNDEQSATHPAAGLYTSQNFAGAQNDFSAYHLDMLKFVQTGAAAFTVQTIPTTLVSSLNNGGSGGTADDVSGNGLVSLLTPIGCPAHAVSISTSQGGGTLYYGACGVVGDGTHGPATMPDGTATSTFEPKFIAGSPPTINTTSILYGNLNQGVVRTSAIAQSARTEGMPAGAYLGPIFPGLLNSVVDGLGDSAGWGYGSLALGMTICRDGIPGYSIGPVTNTATCQVTGTGGLVDHRNYYFSSSMPVVMGMVQSNGIGGLTGARSAIYGYNQAMYNHYGRGFEGFNQIIAESGNASENRQTTTITTYNQEFPLIGKVACVHTLVPGSGTTNSVQCLGATTQAKGQVVRAETDNYQCATDTNGALSGFGTCPQGNTLTPLPTGTVAFQPVLSSQAVLQSDLNSGGAVSHADTTDTWDNYGNLTNQTVTRGDDATGGQFVFSATTQTSNLFDPPNTGTWWVNELQTSTVTSSMVYASGHTPPSGAGPLTQTLTTGYTWNADRTPATKTVQAGAANQQSTTTYAYPAMSYGLPSSVMANAPELTPPLSPTRTMSYTYTSDGYFVLTTTNAKNQATTTTHETNDGQVLTATDPNGVQVVTTYDPFGRATQIRHFGGTGTFESPVQIAYTRCAGSCAGGYAEDGNEANAAYRVTTVQAGYPTQVAWYDLLGRPIKTAARGYTGTFVETRTDYDDMGTVAEKFAPFYSGSAQYFTAWLYDALNRPTVKTSPASEMDPTHGNFVTDYSYSGRTTAIVTHAANVTCPGTASNLCMTMSRSQNALGQYMQTTDARGGATNYWTEPFGHVMAMEDAEGNYTTAQYNALGQRTQSSDPDQGTWNFTYDAFGELLTQTDARGVATTVTSRDALGRTTQQQQVPPSPLPPGLANESVQDTWIFDPVNGIGELYNTVRRRGTNTTPGSNPVTWSETYGYDTDARPSTITTTISEGTPVTLNSAMGYDANGRPSTHTYPSGLVVQTMYGPYGHAGAIANGTSGAIWYETTAEDAWGKVTNESYVDGTTGTIVDYQSTGQEHTASWSLGAGTVDSLTYTYDSFGNVTKQTRSAGASTNTETYGFDVLQRLTTATRAVGAPVSYGYSASGNLLSKSDFASSYTYGSVGSSTHCGPHAAIAAGGYTYRCDKNGNVDQSSLGALAITYDADNHPRTASRNGSSDTWAYDAKGAIDYQTAGSGVRYFGPGGYEQVGSTDIHELGPIVVTQNGSTTTITSALRDRLGSTIDTIDAGTPVFANTRAFDAFGATRNGDLSNRTNGTLNLADTIHGFTKHEHADDVWLIHMGGRIYDYNLGRFLSVDPLVGNALSSQSLNPYSYIANNPLSGKDPTGYTACSEVSSDSTNTSGSCDVSGSNGKTTSINYSFNGNGDVGISRSASAASAAVSIGVLAGNGADKMGPSGASSKPNSGAASDIGAMAQTAGQQALSIGTNAVRGMFPENAALSDQAGSGQSYSNDAGGAFVGAYNSLARAANGVSSLGWLAASQGQYAGPGDFFPTFAVPPEMQRGAAFGEGITFAATLFGAPEQLGAKGAEEIGELGSGKALMSYYPPNNGFAEAPGQFMLLRGTTVDRYGGTGGSFLSPQGTPPWARALPYGAEERGLRSFEVLKPFDVSAGRTSPWFGQMGGGIQYDLGRRTVNDLISGGYLRETP